MSESDYSDGSGVSPEGVGRWGQDGVRSTEKKELWLGGPGGKDRWVQLGSEEVGAGVRVESRALGRSPLWLL